MSRGGNRNKKPKDSPLIICQAEELVGKTIGEITVKINR